MKNVLRILFSSILNPFEQGSEAYTYKASHRKVLIVVGILFLLLSTVSFVASLSVQQWGGLLPAFVFFAAGLVSGVVGALGSDRAVAKIWGNR